MIATVERKTFENLVASLSDGTLAFQMQRLSEVARAAVVVEGRYSALFKLEHVPSAFIADGLARLQVRYPEIPVPPKERLGTDNERRPSGRGSALQTAAMNSPSRRRRRGLPAWRLRTFSW